MCVHRSKPRGMIQPNTKPSSPAVDYGVLTADRAIQAGGCQGWSVPLGLSCQVTDRQVRHISFGQPCAPASLYRIDGAAVATTHSMCSFNLFNLRMRPCRHVAVMAPVAVTLQRQLRAAGGGAAETPHERAFQQRYLATLREALARLQQPAPEDVTHPEAAWKPLKRLRDAMAVQLRCAGICRVLPDSEVDFGIQGFDHEQNFQWIRKESSLFTSSSQRHTPTKPKSYASRCTRVWLLRCLWS